MAGDQQHIHDPVKAEDFARALGLQVGGAGHPFVGSWGTKGLYAYRSGQYNGMAYFGTGGTERDRLDMPHESDKYRPWNRYDPDIPAHIREKLIKLEDDDSTSIGQPARTETSTKNSPTSMPPSVTVSGAGSQEVNGTYVFKSGEHDNRHWGTIAGHYQHTQNPEIFIAFQDCGAGHNRPDWNKWMIISKIGVLYAAHTGGKNGVPPREGGWETVDSWGNPGAPGGKHPAPTVRHGDQDSDAATRIQEHTRSTIPSDVGVTHCKPGPRLTYADSEAYAAKMEGRLLTLDEAKALMGGKALYPGEDQWCAVQGRDWVQVGDLHHHPGKSHNRECGGYPPWGDDANNTTYGNSTWNYVALYKAADGTSPKPTISLSSTGQKESIEILEAVTGKPVRFKINNRPSSNDAWVGIYPLNASDQDHGEHNKRWKWLRDIDVNNASFAKQSEGQWSIRVFSDGGHTLHERKDFTISAPIVKAEPLDPAAVESTRNKAWTALVIGLLLLAPGIPLFIIGLGGGFQYEAVSSGTFEILDEDGQGDYGFEIFIEGEAGDFDGDGFHDYCENVVISANHTGGWFSTGPHGEIVAENPSDESREVFYLEIAHEGSEGCVSHHQPEQASHDGVQLIKIGRACKDCMNGTTTITAQNVEGGEILMWIRAEENQEKLGMLIPGAIMMGIGALTVIGSLGILAKTRHYHGRIQATSADSSHISRTPSNAGNWFTELVKESEAISLQLSQPDERSYHERSTERMKYPDKEKVEEDIRLGNSLQKWYAHWLHDAEKSSKIAEALGLGVGGAGSDFTGKWRTDGLFAYRSGKYNGYAYFGTGGSDESRLEPLGDDEKYRPWNRDDPNMPNDIREKLLMLEKVLARSYYLDPPNKY